MVRQRILNFNEQVVALPFSLNHFVVVSPIWIEAFHFQLTRMALAYIGISLSLSFKKKHFPYKTIWKSCLYFHQFWGLWVIWGIFI